MGANPAIYDGLMIYRGFVFTKLFTCKDSSGAIIDLTGFTAQFDAKPRGASSNIISYVGPPGIQMGGTAGTITVTIDAQTTAGLTVDELVFTLSVNDGVSSRPIIIGVIPVSGDAF